MNENIDVIKGKKNMKMKERGSGKVRLKDVGGEDVCNLYLDEKGVEKLVLIRIDKMNVDEVEERIKDKI